MVFDHAVTSLQYGKYCSATNIHFDDICNVGMIIVRQSGDLRSSIFWISSNVAKTFGFPPSVFIKLPTVCKKGGIPIWALLLFTKMRRRAKNNLKQDG